MHVLWSKVLLYKAIGDWVENGNCAKYLASCIGMEVQREMAARG